MMGCCKQFMDKEMSSIKLQPKQIFNIARETLMRYLVMAIRTPQFQNSVIDAHKEYLAQLKADGALELAGPFTDKTGGAYVVVANDLKAAQAIAFNDPIYISGASEITVYEWSAD